MINRAILCFVLIISLACFACTSPETSSVDSQASPTAASEAININTASQAELTRIPSFGEKIAAAIVAHREEHGQFRRPEDLLLLDGISDRRFREIRHLIRVD